MRLKVGAVNLEDRRVDLKKMGEDMQRGWTCDLREQEGGLLEPKRGFGGKVSGHRARGSGKSREERDWRGRGRCWTEGFAAGTVDAKIRECVGHEQLFQEGKQTRLCPRRSRVEEGLFPSVCS